MKRKILSLALALCLCASYFPTTGLALAEEPDPADAVETPAPAEAAEEPVEEPEQPTEEPEEPEAPAEEAEEPAPEPEPTALEDVPMAIAFGGANGGDGGESSPYEINTLEQLKAFRDYINADEDGGSGEYFKLTASIDLGGSDEWTPIGAQTVELGVPQEHPFKGTFDGGWYTISGLYINTLLYYSGLFGQNYGTIKNLIVSGNVANGLFTGGIVGQNRGSIKNCYYSGNVQGDDAGGIVGNNYSGSIENCYNIGTVSNTDGSNKGGIVALNSSIVSNCYYLNTCGGEGAGTAKTAEEFKSGEVAWLLQNGQDTPEQVWGQKLGEGGDDYPVFTSDTSKKALKVTFATQDNENYAAKYTNPNGTVEMPENPEGENFTFKKWVKTQETNGEEFEAGTPITEDMTVYAVGSITSGATGECHLTNDFEIYNSYGYEAPITANLDECMKKAFEIPEGSEGSFTYVISDQSGLGDTVATIEDNILTIPTGLKSGEYTITVTATEKEPQYSLMSLSGDSDLTLNVKFSIYKLFEETPKLSIDYVNETLIGFESDASYTITAGGEYVYLEDGVLKLTNHLGKYIRVLRNPRDENHTTSTSWSMDLPTRPASPVGPTGEAPTTHDGNGKITGADTTMEYREKTDGNTDAWKDCTEGEIEVAPNKTYEVRAKAVAESSFASEIKEVNVPAFTPKTITGTVTIDGDAIFGQQLTAVTTAVDPNSINFTYQWQRSGDSGYTNIDGATAKTYTLTVADVGKTIQVVVTANDPDHTGSLTSAATGEVQKATITGIEVTANPDITAYTGEAQTLVNVTGNQDSDTIEYKVEKKGAGDDYSEVGTENKATDAGTYKVTVTVQREGYEDHVSDVEVTIAKADSSATAPTAKEHLTYTGAAQQLIDDAGTATGGPMKYYVGESAPSDESQWEADVTQITGTNAQTYTVWYKVAGDANHNDTMAQSITATIDKAAPGVKAPKALELTYTGEAQTLAEAGSTDGGNMTYSDSEGGTYSDSIPQGTEAKTYEVWYKVTGDANHTDAAPAKIDVTIAQAMPVVTVDAVTGTYGQDITLTAEVTSGAITAENITGTVTFKAGETELGTASAKGEGGKWTVTVPGIERAKQQALFDQKSVTATYSGNDNIKSGSGEGTATVAAKALTYTVTAEGREYNGANTIDVTLEPNDLVAGDTVTLSATGTLSAADAKTYDTVDLSDITKAGVDEKYYSVAGTDPGATIQGGVTISPRVVELAWTLDGGESFTVDYTGAAHTPAATVSNKALDGDDVTVTVQVKSDGDDGADKAIEVGAYTATATELTGTAQGNYTLNGCDNTTQKFSIRKVMATATAPTPNTGLTYTGEPQALLVTAGSTEDGTMVYALGDNAETQPGDEAFATDTAKDIPTGTDAGTYYVWWKVQGNVDHTDTAPACLTVTIAQAAVTVTAPTAKELTYTGAPQELIDAGKVESTVEGCGTMQYSLEAEGGFTADLPTGTDAKAYTVYWKVDGADETNYKYSGDISGQVTVTIAKAQALVTTPPTPVTATYTGEAQALVEAGSATGGTMKYALGDAAQATADYSDAIPEGTDAGTYTVWYYVQGDANHTDAEPAQVEVTIDKAASTATVTGSAGLTYTGEPQALIAAGSATGGTINYALGGAAPADDDQWKTDAVQITGTAAGTYTVWYKVVGDANHTDAEPAQVEVTIERAAATVAAPTANADLTYTGASQALIVPGGVTCDAAGCGEVWYSLETGSGFSATIPTGTDAGTYTVYWLISGGDTDNYAYSPATNGEVEVTIGRAQAAVTTPPTPVTATYTGEAIALVSGGEANFGTLVYSLTEAGPFTDEVPTETEAGRYTVYYRVEGTSNWNASEVGSVQAVIRRAASSAVPPAAKEGLTYTGAAQPLVTAGSTADGEEVYVLGDNATDAPGEGYELAVPTGTNAGTYYVWWKVQGDIDHSDTAPACVTVTIAPAALSFQPVAVETPYTGEAIFVPVAQTAGQTPAIDPEKLAVSYEQDGAAVEPILPGTYDVLVNLTDPNFALADGAERVKVGTLTITHVHVYGEAWAHDRSSHWHVCQGVGPCDAPRNGLAAHQLTWVDAGDGTGYQVCAVCGYVTGEHAHASETWHVDEAGGHYKTCDTCGATFAQADHQLTWVDDGDGTGHQACTVCGYVTGEHVHVWDEGVVTQAPTAEAEGSRLYTCSVCGATKSEPISKLNTYQISGLVTDHAGNPLAGAAVRLTQGQETVAETVTDSQGRYSFSSVPAGLYNVAATWEEVTKTILVEITDADAGQRDIQMPEGKTNSVVEVLGEDTPDVVVGGVDAVAEAEATSPAETVTVTLTVAKEEEPTDKEEIDQLVAGQKDDVLYLDLSLLKQVNTQPAQAITDTGARVLEIVVPYDFTGKRSVTVYRKHGDDPAAALTALAVRPDLAAAEDGTFFADEENGRIAIYASKFSTYAIGYQTASSGSSRVTRYVLTATAGEGGTIDPAGATRVRRGDSQSYAIRPEAGYAVADVLVDGASVGAVTTYTFENVTSAHTIQAVFQKVGAGELPFTDVASGDWFYDSARDVYQRGLMQGVAATTFAPDQSTTRATVATILWRLAGEPASQADPAYPDVSGDAWYAQAVAWAGETGVVKGYGDGRFGPDDPITREQLAVMLWRYAAAQGQDVSVGEDTNLLSYQDADQIGDWAFAGLQWAAGSGVLQGTGSGATLSPKAIATRAQLATMLVRYLGRE